MAAVRRAALVALGAALRGAWAAAEESASPDAQRALAQHSLQHESSSHSHAKDSEELGVFQKVGRGYCRAESYKKNVANFHPWMNETLCLSLEECQLRCLHKGADCAGLAWAAEPKERNLCHVQNKPRCNLYYGTEPVYTTSTHWQEYDCYVVAGNADVFAAVAGNGLLTLVLVLLSVLLLGCAICMLLHLVQKRRRANRRLEAGKEAQPLVAESGPAASPPLPTGAPAQSAWATAAAPAGVAATAGGATGSGSVPLETHSAQLGQPFVQPVAKPPHGLLHMPSTHGWLSSTNSANSGLASGGWLGQGLGQEAAVNVTVTIGHDDPV